mgnify:FL=1|jgi:hypothetical protein|tara:strand:+ start:535 stop:792 length:258 start_codon:yes stop_codon:yes gene_type:complete
MKRNYRKAFTALQKIGAPVHVNEDGMWISGEDNTDDEIWADYYDCYHWNHDGWDCGVNGKINKILNDNGLMCEWQNPGLLWICEA